MTKRIEHPPVVILEWHDSRSLTGTWKDRQRVLDEAPTDYRDTPITAGFLLAVTKRYVVVALSMSPQNDDVSQVVQIPRSEIRWMKKLAPRRGFKLVDAKKDRA